MIPDNGEGQQKNLFSSGLNNTNQLATITRLDSTGVRHADWHAQARMWLCCMSCAVLRAGR